MVQIPPKRWLTTRRLLLVRNLVTLIGAALMVVGSWGEWVSGVDGTELGNVEYFDLAFGNPPDRVDDVVPLVTSVGLVPMGLAGLAALGLLGRKARLTRFIAILALLGSVAFAVTLARIDVPVGAD